ncbi:MAG: conjugal transfer protein TraC, partial [Magnetococcales bacterium]|nr:conjugal transfer protein TraC [Magnetococcales bacterium]
RQTVFVGTTNNQEFLKDSTGNRRFLPIEVGIIDLDGLKNEREQLFAEAVAAYKSGEKWWLDAAMEDEVQEIQEHFTQKDPWDKMVKDYLDSHKYEGITVESILKEIEPEEGKWSRASSTRIGEIVHSLGWKKKRPRTEGKREWRYFHPDHDINKHDGRERIKI